MMMLNRRRVLNRNLVSQNSGLSLSGHFGLQGGERGWPGWQNGGLVLGDQWAILDGLELGMKLRIGRQTSCGVDGRDGGGNEVIGRERITGWKISDVADDLDHVLVLLVVLADGFYVDEGVGEGVRQLGVVGLMVDWLGRGIVALLKDDGGDCGEGLVATDARCEDWELGNRLEGASRFARKIKKIV